MKEDRDIFNQWETGKKEQEEEWWQEKRNMEEQSTKVTSEKCFTWSIWRVVKFVINTSFHRSFLEVRHLVHVLQVQNKMGCYGGFGSKVIHSKLNLSYQWHVNASEGYRLGHSQSRGHRVWSLWRSVHIHPPTTRCSFHWCSPERQSHLATPVSNRWSHMRQGGIMVPELLLSQTLWL